MERSGLQALVADEKGLRNLIGKQVRYLGLCYAVVDVVMEDDALILTSTDCSDVQNDEYGRAHRLVPKQQALRFRDAGGAPTSIWDELTFLDGPL